MSSLGRIEAQQQMNFETMLSVILPTPEKNTSFLKIYHFIFLDNSLEKPYPYICLSPLFAFSL